MRTLIAFDVDGIFQQKEEDSQYVKGPLDPRDIEVAFNDNFNCTCMIVSPSPYYPRKNDKTSLFDRHCEWESNTMRWKNLVDCVKSCMVKPDIRIYVSDNGDVKEAKKAGFIYVDVNDFKHMMDQRFKTDELPKEVTTEEEIAKDEEIIKDDEKIE